MGVRLSILTNLTAMPESIRLHMAVSALKCIYVRQAPSGCRGSPRGQLSLES